MSSSDTAPAPLPRAEAFFSAAGPLARTFPDFESRPEQIELSAAIQRALEDCRHLVAEAGTGIGKTLAYLFPALTSGQTVVVSTGTKPLQEQIVEQDVPMLERALDLTVNAQVMKGRTNYLCLHRLRVMANNPLFPSLHDAHVFEAIQQWQAETQTGDRAELQLLSDDNALWRDLTATTDQCLGRKCPDYEQCWVTTMRRRAQTAQLLVVNHHLYLSDLALRRRLGDLGVLVIPPHDVAIFDEAHDLDEIAAHHFGFQVSHRRWLDLLHDVHLFAAAAGPAGTPLRAVVDAVRDDAANLFDCLPFAAHRVRIDPNQLDVVVHDLHRAADVQLERLEGELGNVSHDDAAVLARRTAALAAELAMTLGVGTRPSTIIDTSDAQSVASAELVRYTEMMGRQRFVVARPLRVDRIMQDYLDLPAMFVSATLTVDGSFEHYRSRLGLRTAETVRVGSPFDYWRQVRLYLPSDLPTPDHPRFSEAAAERTAALINASGGGAFVLCTSRRVLPIMREALATATPWRVLTQGDAPRRHLIDTYRQDGNAVLIATMSFWQGVDVPGPGLRLVIIDKLPFASPADPMVAARVEYLRQIGDDPFSTYQVPQAALLLRQGFGRLVRRRSDWGLVAILDRRVTTRTYGATFLRSLPDCPQLSTLADAEAFLRQCPVASSQPVTS